MIRRSRRSAPPAALPVVEPDGLTIPGYSQLEIVGHGATATVYRARQDDFGRTVAIKVLHVDVSDRKARRRFDRERVINGQLSNHPNVVTVLDAGLIDGRTPYLAMEYFEIGSLAQRLAHKGPFPVSEALHVGIRVAGALQSAHTAGILHRDVKPQNILLSRFGEPALADFGIAAILELEQSLTAALTPVHAPPEALEGKEPTARSDVYALASTVYTLLAGTPPFAGPPGEGVLAQLLRITTMDLPAFTRTDVSESFVEALRQATAKRPDERTPSAGEFARQLQDVQAELGFGATSIPVEEMHIPPPPADPYATPTDDPTMGRDDVWRPRTAAPEPAAAPTGTGPVLDRDPDSPFAPGRAMAPPVSSPSAATGPAAPAADALPDTDPTIRRPAPHHDHSTGPQSVADRGSPPPVPDLPAFALDRDQYTVERSAAHPPVTPPAEPAHSARPRSPANPAAQAPTPAPIAPTPPEAHQYDVEERPSVAATNDLTISARQVPIGAPVAPPAKRRGVLLGSLAVVAALVGAGGALVLRERNDEPTGAGSESTVDATLADSVATESTVGVGGVVPASVGETSPPETSPPDTLAPLDLGAWRPRAVEVTAGAAGTTIRWTPGTEAARQPHFVWFYLPGRNDPTLVPTERDDDRQLFIPADDLDPERPVSFVVGVLTGRVRDDGELEYVYTDPVDRNGAVSGDVVAGDGTRPAIDVATVTAVPISATPSPSAP